MTALPLKALIRLAIRVEEPSLLKRAEKSRRALRRRFKLSKRAA